MVCLMRHDSPSVRFALPFSNHHRRYALFGKDV
jgi:hypothetical protein